jgi:hypothetical protein
MLAAGPEGKSNATLPSYVKVPPAPAPKTSPATGKDVGELQRAIIAEPNRAKREVLIAELRSHYLAQGE